MLIDDLIRQGRAVLDSGDFEPKEVLRLVTGVEDVRVKNFYQHVFVVEVPAEENQSPRVLPMQGFGSLIRENGKEDFRVAGMEQAVGAPIAIPIRRQPAPASGSLFADLSLLRPAPPGVSRVGRRSEAISHRPARTDRGLLRLGGHG